MRKLLIIIISTISIIFLSSCVGVPSIRIDNFLENNNCLYNEEYGIELNKKFDTCYSVGFITCDNITIEVFVVWNSPVLKADFYNIKNIENGLTSDEDCFKYLDSEESRNNIILSVGIICKDDTLILNDFEGYYENIDEIVLYIR